MKKRQQTFTAFKYQKAAIGLIFAKQQKIKAC